MNSQVSALLREAERRWGRGVLVRLGDVDEAAEVEVVPTGFPALDAALGIGGLPCGRISEIFGPDSSGKQALVGHLVVQCQRSEGVAAYIDPGRRLDIEQMRALGVDFQSLLVAQPSTGLEALEMAIRLARSGGIRLMVFDFALDSALNSALRRLVSAVDRNSIAFVFLTSLPLPLGERERARWHVHGGEGKIPPPRSTGALRFFASVRLGMERVEWIRRGRDVIGCRSLVRVAKNKLASPLREAVVELLFQRFPPAAPLLQIQRSGPESQAELSIEDVGVLRLRAVR